MRYPLTHASTNNLSIFREFGEPGGARTRDHRIKSAMLYQLSYRLQGLTNWKAA